MSDGQKPRDLRWPPPPDELEPFETLEIVRDETGRDRWRRGQRAPEVPDAYREWLPKRLGRESAVQHDELDLFPSAEPKPATTVPPTVDAPPEPATPAPPGAALQPVLLPAPRPAAQVDAPVPALRLSLVPSRLAPLVASSSVDPRVLATAERLGLFAAGALVGAVLALSVTRDSTPDRAGDERRPVLVTQQAAPPSPTAEVPPPTIARQDAVPAAPAAPVAPVAQGARAGTATLAPPPTPVEPPASVTPATPAPVTPAAPALAPARPAPALPPDAGPRASVAPPQTPPTPRAARATRGSGPPASEGPAVIGTVEQYAMAWSRLDVRATQALWPSVDRQALVGTFTSIREQRLTLANCKATVVTDRAAVTCRGTLRYRPRVGEHSTRTEQGRWTFDLDRDDQSWVIASVGRP